MRFEGDVSDDRSREVIRDLSEIPSRKGAPLFCRRFGGDGDAARLDTLRLDGAPAVGVKSDCVDGLLSAPDQHKCHNNQQECDERERNPFRVSVHIKPPVRLIVVSPRETTRTAVSEEHFLTIKIYHNL